MHRNAEASPHSASSWRGFCVLVKKKEYIEQRNEERRSHFSSLVAEVLRTLLLRRLRTLLLSVLISPQ
jgi:hypothetical protein